MAHTLVRETMSDFRETFGYQMGRIRNQAYMVVLTHSGKDTAIVVPLEHFNAVVEDASRWRQLRIAAEQGRPSPYPDIALVGVPPASDSGQWVDDEMTQDKAVRYATRALTDERAEAMTHRYGSDPERLAAIDRRLANLDAAIAVLNGMVGR